MTNKKTTRIKMAIRYNWTCVWCDAPLRAELGYQNTATVDHYIPVAKGGKNSIKNYRAACNRCNQSRGCMDAEQFSLIARTYEFNNGSIKHTKIANNRAKFMAKKRGLARQFFVVRQDAVKSFGPKQAVDVAYKKWVNNESVDKKTNHFLEYVAYTKIVSVYGRPTVFDKCIYYLTRYLNKPCNIA